MTLFFRSRFFFNKFLQNNIVFSKIERTSVKQDQNFFKRAAKGAVANSGSDNSLLFSFRNGCGSAAIKFNKEW